MAAEQIYTETYAPVTGRRNRLRALRPQHSCAGHQQDCAQDSSQPEYGDAGAQLRAENSSGNRADQQGSYEMSVDVARPPVQKAGDSGENDGVGDVGANHDFRRE